MAGMAEILLKAGKERGIDAVVGEVPDTVLVCRDGRVHSHRLLLAATGQFLRTLLERSFLPGEDSLVLLPEHSLRDLLQLLPATLLLGDGSLLVGDQLEPKLEDSSGEEWQGEGDERDESGRSEFAKVRKQDSSGKLLASEEREELDRAVEKLLRRGGSYNLKAYNLARDRKRRAREGGWVGKKTKEESDVGHDDVHKDNFDDGDVGIEDPVKIEADRLDVDQESSGKAEHSYVSNDEDRGDACDSDSEEDSDDDDDDYEEDILKSRKRALGRVRGSAAKTRSRNKAGELLPNPDRIELIREVDKLLVKDGEDWSCGVCNKKCTEKEKGGKTYGNIRAHVESHLPKELRQRAGRKFASNKVRGDIDLQIDEIIGRSGELWLCTMCMKTGPSKYSIRNHIETHLEFKCCCELCGKQFQTRDNLRSHTTFVHVEGNIAMNLTCEQCGKTGMSKSALSNHVRRHHNVKKSEGFKCPLCNVVVKDRCYLKTHMKKLHDPNRPPPKLNTCEYCGKSGMTNRMYAGHKRRNHADKHKIDLETKVAVIRAREQPDATTKEVARSFNLGLSTVQLIIRNKDVHIAEFSKSKDSTDICDQIAI